MQSIFDMSIEGAPLELGNDLQARPNSFSVSPDYTSWLDVLENEYNPNDADLIITQINGQAISVGETINLFGGTLTLFADQRLGFTADQEASVLPDLVRFNYTVSGGGEESTALVTLDLYSSGNSRPQTTSDEVFVDFGGSVTIDALANDSDADGDALMITEISYIPVAIGDSVSVYGGTATLNADQTIGFESDREDQGAIAYTSFDYTVSDGLSESRGYISITSEPSNYAPQAYSDAFAGTIGETITLDVLANDTDDEGDALSIIEINGQQIAVGETFDSGLGEVTLNADQTLTFASMQDDNGRDAYVYFNYTLSDGLSVSRGYVNGTLASNNYAPNAYSDSSTGGFGETLTIDVLANDNDQEGDALTITEVNNQAIAVGETVTSTSAEVTLNADQTLTVVPLQEDQGERGYLYIYYEVSDGSNDDGSYIALTLEPENYAPFAGSDSINIASGESAILNVLANDSDEEGDALTIASINGVSIAVGETISNDGFSITLNQDQTLSITGSNVTTGRRNYDSFRYELTDGLNSNEGFVSVSVEPANYAPETRFDDFDILVDESFQADVLANDEDAEGTALSIVQLDGRIITPGQSLALNNGTATLNEDQTLTFVFEDAALGNQSISYGVSDGEFIVTDYIYIDVVSTDLVRGDFSTNALLSINETVDGRIDQADDHDWYAVNLEAGQTYEISMRGNGGALSLNDPILTILDANGETVASDYPYYSNEDASISLTPEDSGLFFVNAGGYFRSSIGDFELTITGPSPQPPTDSSFNIIEATETRDRLSGTAEADSFVFAEGSSTLGTIDTVIDWQPGDVIDLSAFGFAEGDIEARLVSSGSVVKLIAGFGEEDFQVRINLNGYTLQQLREAIVFDSLPGAIPANQAPIAIDDDAAGVTGALTFINVLDNDSDPDGDSIVISSFTQAENGVVTPFSDNRFTYEPNDGFTGTDNFTYTIIDADGALSTATVTVDVAPILFFSGTSEDDILDGTSEIDFINGLEGNDTLRGLENNDRLFGGEGDDTLIGGDGDDSVHGGDGDDTLIGGNGWDWLVGGAGNDTYNAGAGFDDIYLEGLSRSEDRDTDSNTIIFTPSSDIDILLEVRLPDGSMAASFDLQRDVIDVTAFNITAAQALTYLYQHEVYDAVLDFGDFNQLFLDGIEASDLTEANFIGVTISPPPPSEDFNVIEASDGRENIDGTDADDAYTFAVGTSVNGAIDTVLDWAPGDIIDLSGLGLSAEDFEVRTISGGTVIKLIEGFGAGEFHVKINLNGFSQEEVLASVIYDAAPPPDLLPETVDDNYEFSSSATFTFDVLENDIDPDGGVFELISFTQPSSGQLTLLEGGVFEFVPDQGTPQSTQFTYTAGDPNGVSSTATVSLEYVGQTIILGTDEDDILYGTPGPDSLVGFNGNDQLFGLEGDDSLVVDDGDAYLDGGPGNDALRGEFGNFTFLGGTGEDRLFLARDTLNQDELVNTIILRPGDGTDTIVGPKTTNEDGEIVIQSTLFLAENDKIDISAFNLTAAQALSLARQEGQSTFIDLGDGDGLVIEGLDVSTLLEATFIGVQPPGDYNVVNASVGQENINGTDAADAFTFTAGTSVNGAIDTIVDWAPGDVIDLSALGLTADNFEVRLAGGGSILKLIEGFGEDEFHVKVNLNGNTQQDVLDSIIYAEPLPPGTFNIIDGTDEQDSLTGTNQADQISGFAGRDFLQGEAGNDLLIGGEGQDFLYGDEGDDRLEGESGDDIFRTGTGNDFADGGEGVDTIWYYAGDSVNAAITADLSLGIATYTLDGVAYTDTFVSIENISGGIADDTLRGDANANEIMGQNGHDIIYGGLGNDRLLGMVGDDIVYGGEGDDTIFGGDGRDTLIGGPGNDTLRPGDSVDTLVFETGDGFDTVGDINSWNSRVEFDALSDKIDVTGLGLTRTQALETAVQDGENTFLDFGNGDGILILYFDASSLRVSNFIGVDTEAPASTAPIASEAASNQAFEAVKNWESLEVDGAKSNTSTIFEPVKDFENLSENVSELISEMFEPAQSNVAMVYDWGMDHNQSGAFAGDLLPASIQPLEAALYGFGFVEAPIDEIPWDIA